MSIYRSDCANTNAVIYHKICELAGIFAWAAWAAWPADFTPVWNLNPIIPPEQHRCRNATRARAGRCQLVASAGKRRVWCRWRASAQPFTDTSSIYAMLRFVRHNPPASRGTQFFRGALQHGLSVCQSGMNSFALCSYAERERAFTPVNFTQSRLICVNSLCRRCFCANRGGQIDAMCVSKSVVGRAL